MNGQYIAGKRLTCCTAEKGETAAVISGKDCTRINVMLSNVNYENITDVSAHNPQLSGAGGGKACLFKPLFLPICPPYWFSRIHSTQRSNSFGSSAATTERLNTCSPLQNPSPSKVVSLPPASSKINAPAA